MVVKLPMRKLAWSASIVNKLSVSWSPICNNIYLQLAIINLPKQYNTFVVATNILHLFVGFLSFQVPLRICSLYKFKWQSITFIMMYFKFKPNFHITCNITERNAALSVTIGTDRRLLAAACSHIHFTDEDANRLTLINY